MPTEHNDDEDWHEESGWTGIVSLLVLGVGLTALFLDVENWWAVFAIGYAVVVPLVAILEDPTERPTLGSGGGDGRDETRSDATLGAR